jgi:diguanylate cyclase (GGDEF)-like protein
VSQSVPAPQAVVLLPAGNDLPAAVAEWLTAAGIETLGVHGEDELLVRSLRGRPRLIVLDGRHDVRWAAHACARLKADSYTGVVPAVLLCEGSGEALGLAFAAGADEVLATGSSPLETHARLAATVQRSDRDTQVHPSTRLPGTVAIDAEIGRRIAGGAPFGVCYADLDHFKEYNDRYSYFEGDRVIRVVARILHDVVKGLCGEHGFVGHIGGDDFIFILPASDVQSVCAEVVAVFDALSPYQYSESDRRAGYFFGKDRRGQLHRVPLMTLSIGVVTNERRHFTTASQVSELATEMKGYAKTLPGSVYSVDRRQDLVTPGEPAPPRPTQPLTATND